MPPSNVEVVRTFLEGLARGSPRMELGELFDLGVNAGIIAPDFELMPARDLEAGKTYRGRDGAIEFMRRWIEDFDDWTFEVEEMVDAPPDKVVAVMTQRGTGKGSGVPVELRHGAIYELEAGRIVRARLYIDPEEPFRAAGLRS